MKDSYKGEENIPRSRVLGFRVVLVQANCLLGSTEGLTQGSPRYKKGTLFGFKGDYKGT